ncbi:DUF262 domain-containing protein [Staphylococcus pettenkoferi]|mgnify:CR=1 FL=1|uniref:DUF262 domain-containing protein n=2 Tax=Staphylococcus pettenkoferi TaxID=170573 RepID=UPI00066E347D|nr:DUF262 domain-containing protein [Staphylococcus pettenkoferi]MCY1627122.1 DUF262 domain-containing HNH endonuclease family protein [Staphylococcus pettenkoferi]PNZ86339.1 DUF262 domain-containing protein [Staphylococcus pettenkoferi]QQC38404.1 DUF262 domain-containing protein [Staphylococcus pettenkoferi]UIK49020.1 DUF262 domain-containing HNH endonuclease family protein [Staphylococcus pettenkoferi]
MSIINSNSRSLGSYLAEHKYYIPDYQRGYSWEYDELEDFWADLKELVEEDYESHFFGQIVIHSDDETKRKYIIDGQQRTTTAVILLDTLREKFDYFAKEYNIEDAEYDSQDITSKYIGCYTEKRNDVRLVLGENDKIFFQEYIQSKKTNDIDNKKLTKSEQRIKDTKEGFEKLIDEYIENTESYDDKYQKVYTLYKSLIDNFTVMFVETNDINEAFIIFETLNARGKDLETSDLLKNHLFRIASKNINHVKTQWEKMLDNLGKSDATKFIRHYWNSQDKFIREKDLYKKIRKSIDSTKKVNDLISDLSTLSTLYNAIDKPNEAIYFSSTDLNEKIKDISILGAKSYYPIIISLVKENYDEKEILDFLHVLETLIVRNFVVAGKVANKYELSFSKIAEDITQQELTNIDEVKERIKGLIINNEDFKYFFETFSVKKKNVIRFLFRALHNYNNKETRILRDNNKIHIEHIMPQNIDNWDIDHDTYENYLWRFGNLTLLAEEYNKSIINKPFKQKKEIYKESKINLTRDLIHYDEWTDYEIIERQKKLANIALKVWSLN